MERDGEHYKRQNTTKSQWQLTNQYNEKLSLAIEEIQKRVYNVMANKKRYNWREKCNPGQGGWHVHGED